MKLEVGMYARTEDGELFKIVDIREGKAIYLKGIFRYGKPIKYITKTSNFILGIVKQGDFINGVRVSKRKFDAINKGNMVMMNKDVKAILTKEQYEASVFKVIRDEN